MRPYLDLRFLSDSKRPGSCISAQYDTNQEISTLPNSCIFNTKIIMKLYKYNFLTSVLKLCAQGSSQNKQKLKSFCSYEKLSAFRKCLDRKRDKWREIEHHF